MSVAAASKPEVDWDSTDVGHDLFHDGLTVEMIMTDRSKIFTCDIDERISDVVARNAERFSFTPVLETGRFVGLLRTEEWFESIPPNGTVRDTYTSLSEANLIGSNANIIEFVLNADQRPCCLVVSGHRIEGLVSLSDLQKLPVRASIFALITGLELEMAKFIRKAFPNSKDWKKFLSVARAQKIDDEIALSKSVDGYVDELLFTQFSDKADIIRKGIELKFGKKDLKSRFSRIRDLRDQLAHANNYANSPETARKAVKTVNLTFELKRLLSHS